MFDTLGEVKIIYTTFGFSTDDDEEFYIESTATNASTPSLELVE